MIKIKFSENLVYLRKEHNLSQEDLADKLGVSRQAVSKWELGTTYPEMDKLITICNLFNCTMDDLVTGAIVKENQNIKLIYNNFYNKFSRVIAFGVALILIGVSTMLSLYHFVHEDSILPVTVFLLFILISVSIFILNGLEADDFKKLHSKEDNPYTKEDYIKELASTFNKGIVCGVIIILVGIIILIIGSNSIDAKAQKQIFDINVSYYLIVAIFFLFVAVASYLFVYYGIQREKYNLNYQIDYQVNAGRIERYSSVIMISATIIYFILGFIFNLWHPGWIVFPIGGMLCGIVSSIFTKYEDK